MFELLEAGASFAEVADWLSTKDVRLPPAARSTRWGASLVSYVVRNPIVKGERVRNTKISKRVNKTGRHKSVNAPPEDRLVRQCPHLAFIEPARFDRLMAKLDQKNGNKAVGHATGIDPRINRPKKRSPWPGQHLYCGICGRVLVYAGGKNAGLMCKGARDYKCWNSAGVNVAVARPLLAAAILDAVRSIPTGFDEEVVAVCRELLQASGNSHAVRAKALEQQIEANCRGRDNTLIALRDLGSSPTLLAELARFETELVTCPHEPYRGLS